MSIDYGQKSNKEKKKKSVQRFSFILLSRDIQTLDALFWNFLICFTQRKICGNDKKKFEREKFTATVAKIKLSRPKKLSK